MDAIANFSLRFARKSESKVERTDWVLSRQTLQGIATRMSLLGEAIGFSILGILILTRLSLLEGKIGYFLEEIAHRGA